MYYVIRTLVYGYPDADDALLDMGRWAMPANGMRKVGLPRGRSISSATTPLEKVVNPDERLHFGELNVPIRELVERALAEAGFDETDVGIATEAVIPVVMGDLPARAPR